MTAMKPAAAPPVADLRSGPSPGGVPALVRLTTGEIGLVLGPPPSPEAALRPPIFLVRDARGHPVDGPIIDLAVPGGWDGHRAIAHSLNPQEAGIRLGQYLLPSDGAGTTTAPAQA